MPLLRRHVLCCLMLAVMVVLLPLRGWAGTTMAVGMAAQQVAQQVAAVQASLLTDIANIADMPDDCPMRLAASNTDTDAPSCSGCDTCELCLAIASFTTPQFHATPFSPSAAPDTAPSGFVSADRASGLKPPIS